MGYSKLSEQQKHHLISIELRTRFYIDGEIFSGRVPQIIAELAEKYQCNEGLVSGNINSLLYAKWVAGSTPNGGGLFFSAADGKCSAEGRRHKSLHQK